MVQSMELILTQFQSKPAVSFRYFIQKIKLTYLYLQKIATQQAKTNSTRIPDPITVTAVCVPIPN